MRGNHGKSQTKKKRSPSVGRPARQHHRRVAGGSSGDGRLKSSGGLVLQDLIVGPLLGFSDLDRAIGYARSFSLVGDGLEFVEVSSVTEGTAMRAIGQSLNRRLSEEVGPRSCDIISGNSSIFQTEQDNTLANISAANVAG